MMLAKSFFMTALVAAALAAGCTSARLAPILPDQAFEPVTPMVPEATTVVTGSIFADTSARYRFEELTL